MTREEAIKWLTNIKDKYIHGGDEAFDNARRESIDMAIKALKHEPCEDTISRQSAIDTTWFEPSYTDPLNVLTEVRDRLKALSPAQPERMSNRQWIDFLSAQFDISRTSAKDMLHGMMCWKKEDNFKKKFSRK